MENVAVNGTEYAIELTRPADADTTRVHIYANNVWAGSGTLSQHVRIEDCAADLGKDVYDALEDAVYDALERGLYAECDPS